MRTERAGKRGAAMVEAVVVVPVLALIWCSLYFLGDLFVSRQASQAKARSCAWLYSANNCQQVPPGCDGVLHEATGSAPVAPDVESALHDGADRALRGGDAKGIVGTVVGELVAGPLLAAFTRSVEARARRDVPRPAVYGGEHTSVAGRYRLACNLEPTSPEQMATKAWSTLIDR